MPKAGGLQPAHQWQNKPLPRPLIIHSSVKGAPLAMVLGLDVKMLCDDGTASEMGRQCDNFFCDAGQFVHPLVTLADGVRMIGCLSQFVIQLWIIINRPAEGLAGFTLPLDTAAPIRLGFKSRASTRPGWVFRFNGSAFSSQEIEMWVPVKETVNGTSRYQVQRNCSASNNSR